MTLILKLYLNPSLLVLFHSCLGIAIVILLKESFIIYEATFNLPVETLTTTDVVTSKEEPGLFINTSKKYLKVNAQSSEEAFLSDSSSNSEYDFSYDITLLLDAHPQLSERGWEEYKNGRHVSTYPDFVPYEEEVAVDVPVNTPVNTPDAKKESNSLLVSVGLVVAGVVVVVVLGVICGGKWS
jgi:hypothetical protein